MRRLCPPLCLVLAPGLAVAAPQCQAPAAAPAQAVVAVGSVAASAAGLPPIAASEIAGSPALSRIASKGALLSELGREHGLRAVFARNGDRFQVFYLAPDNQAVVGGVMWDAQGHNITRDQVAPISGTIPTVQWLGKIGDGHEPGANGVPADARNQVDRIAASTFGLDGKQGAPRVYMVIDPLCPYSVQAERSLLPAIATGRLQLAIVPISINDHENDGASTPAALDLLSSRPDEMPAAWRTVAALGHARPDHPPSTDAVTALQTNMATAHAIGVRGTPTLIWKDAAGEAHQQAGMPDDIEAFLSGLAR